MTERLFPFRGLVYMDALPATEAALAILRGGATRAREAFYPWWLEPLCYVRGWFPSHWDWVVQSFYNYTSA